jgi:hypothetical protein
VENIENWHDKGYVTYVWVNKLHTEALLITDELDIDVYKVWEEGMGSDDDRGKVEIDGKIYAYQYYLVEGDVI